MKIGLLFKYEGCESMGKGREWLPEWKRYRDRFTGVNITQLTDYTGHSNHLYFTENGWYDNASRILFHSDRENKSNLFSIHLESGKITQLTDHDTGYGSMSTSLHPYNNKAYYLKDKTIVEIDLITLDERIIYEGSPTFTVGNINCTSDGKYIITCIREDLSSSIQIDLGRGYIGHRELMEAKPNSKIIKISIADHKVEEVYEENNFITHINTSPKKPNLITFCHEGPWQLVDHRIWCLDLKTNKAWKVRERKESREMVGHEYWYNDGETIGYHGFRENGKGFIGRINYDNKDEQELEFSFQNWHAHSFDFDKIVVDGKGKLDKLIVWNRTEDTFTHPKLLCEHRCSFHVQKVHAHPRFSPDGKQILFTSDKDGYGNLYLVDLPNDLDSLPDFEW